MSNWLTKKTEEITIKIIFLIFTIAFFYKSQYNLSFLSLCLFFLSLKLDTLTEFVISIKDGLRARYQIPDEKIKQDIRDNKKPVNRKNFLNFKKIEERVLQDVQKKVGGSMKRQIHFVYGRPPNIEFAYTPDAVIQTDDKLIFIEIKYVSDLRFAENIIRQAAEKLKMVLEKFTPSAGKKLGVKLILASNFDIDIKKYSLPEGVELELYKI